MNVIIVLRTMLDVYKVYRDVKSLPFLWDAKYV